MFEIGKAYFIRTVTYHLIGRVKAIHELGDHTFLELDEASWVADTERFMQAILEGALREVEPVKHAYVHVGAITDAFDWVHDCPSKQK